MAVFFGFALVYWFFFLLNILWVILYGVDDERIGMLLFWSTGVLTLTPLDIVYLVEKHKQKRLMHCLKKSSEKAECKIHRYSYISLIGGRRGNYHHHFQVEFNYNGKPIMYLVQTNNKKAELYKDADTLPVCYMPAYCDYLTGQKTQDQLFNELGFKVRVNNQNLYPMIVFENDLEHRNFRVEW